MAIGLTQTAASVYQMMKGNLILITALFSYLFLKKKQYVHHFISLVFIVIGIAWVGLASINDKEQEDEMVDPSNDDVQETTVFGLVIMIIS